MVLSGNCPIARKGGRKLQKMSGIEIRVPVFTGTMSGSAHVCPCVFELEMEKKSGWNAPFPKERLYPSLLILNPLRLGEHFRKDLRKNARYKLRPDLKSYI